MDHWKTTSSEQWTVGQTVSIYEVPELVKQAFMSAMTPTNITSGFRATWRLCPINGNRQAKPRGALHQCCCWPAWTITWGAKHATAVPDPVEPPATLLEPNPEHSSIDESGSRPHVSFVSPKVILPLPKRHSKKAQKNEKESKNKNLDWHAWEDGAGKGTQRKTR